MKIPINTSNSLILFDLDNTIIGDREYNQCMMFKEKWSNLFKIKLDPSIFNFIRWSVVSERPRWQRYWIRLILSMHELYPEQILTNDQNLTELDFKINLLNSILSTNGLKHCKRIINKLFYIDSNVIVVKEINDKIKKVNGFSFYAMTIFDFISYDINYIVN